jgi:hypothetical protein
VPTKKQRRRRDKERRHEYEYVYVDEEGREVEVDEAEEEPVKPAKADDRARSRPARTGLRQVQPPSWRRVGKRALIFAPLMFLVVTLLAPKDVSAAQNVAQTLFLLAIFLPFSYAMDALMYRLWRRRTGQTEPAARRR